MAYIGYPTLGMVDNNDPRYSSRVGASSEANTMVMKEGGVVLTEAELDRIRAKVREEPEADSDARRRHLKTLSDERVRHWPNTLEAQRQSKENWKRKQEEEIELRRRGIDRAEAMLQRKLRAETIRKANDKLYEQTGKMKLLRSNLLYAEVIETRKEQMAARQHRHAAEDKLAEAYHREIKRKVAEGDKREEDLARQRADKEKSTAEMQQQQLQEFQDKYILAMKTEKEEGEETQRIAKAAIEAEEEDVRAKKVKGRTEMEKMLAANRDLHKIRAGRISEELAYMEKCKQQRDALDRAARARKAVEQKRFNERQALRQQMIDIATRELEAHTMKNDRKEEREAEEQRRKEDDAAEKTRAAQAKLRADIDHSRAIQMKVRAEKELQQVEEDKDIKAYFKQRTAEMNKMEEDEEAERFAREKQLRASQIAQAQERRDKEMAQQAYDNVNRAKMIAAQGEEDTRFKKIVNKYIDDFNVRGQSTYLLHRTLNHKDPEMFPAGNLKL